MSKFKVYDVPHVGVPIPVAIYARKSKDERARKKMRRAGLEVSQSISHQVKECQKWCEANGRAPVAILKEDLTSGAAESRPRLDEVFALARARMIVEVVVLYFERFSRDEEMEIMAMVAELRRYGVALRVVTEPHLDPSDEYYVMRLSMAAMVARDHYERTSKKVTATLAEVREDGTWCGRTPYGWMRIEDPTEARGNLGLVPDPDQAAILTTAATEHLRGVGLRRLGARFGLDPTNLGRILDRPETAWLIGQDLWDALQAMPKGQRLPQIHAYVFSGLIECGRCKKTLVGNNRKNRSGSLGRYYVCNGRVDHGDHGTNLRHDVVADAIRAQLSGTPLRQSDIAAVRALLAREHEGPSMAELWLRRDRELEAQLDRLIDLHTSGGATREQFDRHAAKIAAERADLGPRPLPVARVDEAIEVVRSLDEVLAELDTSDPTMVQAVHLVLRTVVDTIEFAEGKTAIVHLREPFGRLIEELRATESIRHAA